MDNEILNVTESAEHTEWFECVCHDPEHTFRLSFLEYDPNDDMPPDLYVSVHLSNYQNIFKRLWVAFKYVFLKKDQNIYGHFEQLSFRMTDLSRIRALLDLFEKEHIASGWTYDGIGWEKKTDKLKEK